MLCRQPERMFTSVSAGNLLITMLAVRRLVGVHATTLLFFSFLFSSLFYSMEKERERERERIVWIISLFFSLFFYSMKRETERERELYG